MTTVVILILISHLWGALCACTSIQMNYLAYNFRLHVEIGDKNNRPVSYIYMKYFPVLQIALLAIYGGIFLPPLLR